MAVAVSVVSDLFADVALELLQKVLPTFSSAASAAAQTTGLDVMKANALKGAVQRYF